jgi:aryl-alcohol dehydrogenase-like predicted oxidoreductase
VAKVGKLKVCLNPERKRWRGADIWQPIAEKLGATQSQLALAWCLKNENVSSVITGASRPDQIVENVKCLAVLEKLTAEIMHEIDRVIENKPTQDPARQD